MIGATVTAHMTVHDLSQRTTIYVYGCMYIASALDDVTGIMHVTVHVTMHVTLHMTVHPTEHITVCLRKCM